RRGGWEGRRPAAPAHGRAWSRAPGGGGADAPDVAGAQAAGPEGRRSYEADPFPRPRLSGFPHRHLLGTEPLAAADIQVLLDTADGLKEVLDRPIKKVPTLRGKTVVNLFYEPSTRTRSSFEIAEKVLSADSLSIATATSSATKGETLLDTAKN